jgi:Tol biopolymer transport system component/serine/threonine protein kinase
MNERSIFMEALDKDTPDRRAAYLDEACASDAALRQRMETLLASHVDADSFLGTPVVERLAAQIATDPGLNATCASTPTGADHSLSFLGPSDKPGSLGRLGSYEIEEVIGRGGMGIVLRAFDEKLHRVVAIKVMTAPLATNEHARRRFVREGRAAAAVRDDHVIGIYGVDETNGLPFLVMEYVVGRSLAQRVETEGPLPLADILRVGGQIARGLAAAHSQGLVHRDIKPANILLENGVERVKITDFGLAHAVDDVRTTQPGTVIGTPEYMSPEQARGEKVDHRSDLFSLGCVLYAMCAGRPPFRAESTVAIIRRVCDDTPRPLTEINSDIPGWLVDLIDKLIAKDPNERFQSATEVAELLGQYLAHVQQPAVNPQPAAIAKPQPVCRQTRAKARRRWTIATAAALLLFAGLSLAESTGVTNVAATVIRIVRGDGTLVVEVDDPNIQVLLDGDEIAITGAGPKELRLRPGQHELQSVKDGKPLGTQHVTIIRDGRQMVKVAREPTNAAGAAAGESKSIASAASGPGVAAPQARPDSTEPISRRIWADAPEMRSLYVGDPSPDGKYIAFVDRISGDVAVHELATGTSRRLSNQGFPEAACGNAIFSPDSQQVAYVWYKSESVGESNNSVGELRTIGLDGSQLRVLIPRNEQEITWIVACDWSADGKHILALLKHKTGPQMVLISITDGSLRVLKESAAFSVSESLNARPRLSPDGRYVAFTIAPDKSAPQRDIFLLALDGSGEVALVQHPANDRVVGWTPDGKRLVFTSDRAGGDGLWLIDVAEGKPQGVARLVKRALGNVQPLGLTRTGSFIYAVAAGSQDVYTATIDWEQGKIVSPPEEAIPRALGLNHNPAWSPDGRFLACLSVLNAPDLRVYIKSLETKEVRELAPDLRNFGFNSLLQWSADGRALITHGTSKDGKRGVQRIDVQTGAVTRIPTDGDGLFPSLSPDGKSLFYVSGYKGKDKPGRILRRDLETGVEQELRQTTDKGVLTMLFPLSPDGQHLPFLEGGALKLMSTLGGEPQVLVKSSGPLAALMKGEGLILPVVWTPDGRYLVYQKIHPQMFSLLAKKVVGSPPGPADVKSDLWRVPAAGGGPQKLTDGLPTMGGLSIHPDGRQIAFAGHSRQTDKNEAWILENFLPPLKDSAAAAAAATSSGASQSTAVASSAPAIAAASEASVAEGPSMRLIWDADRQFNTGVSSPDGKYLAYRDLRSNDVAVRDLATGTSRLITQRDHPEYGDFPVFSPDSRQIAFSWIRKDRVTELRTIGIDGTGLRVLFSNQDNEFQSLVPWDWSADGKTIVASASIRGAGQIALISATDGSVRVLKTLDLSAPGKMCFAPDDRYVACSLNVDKSSRQRDIFLLATDGSSEVPLVENPGDDVVLGWTPDGKRLLFASDRTGSIGAWAIALADGKPIGKVELVRPGLGPIEPLGFTRSGELYYVLHSQGTDIYTATLDLETGKVLTPPALAIERGEGSNAAPDWSPDGRFLACASWRFGGSPLFYIRNAESTEARELSPKLKQFSAISLHWSPDGRALIGAGLNAEGQEGVLRIDVQTGAVTMLLARDVLQAGDVFKRSNSLSHPWLAPDGKDLIFQRISEDYGRRILRCNLDTGAEQELYRYAGAGAWALSPDGRQLVIADMSRPTPAPVPRSPNSPQILSFGTGHVLKLIPATGGEPRELAKAVGVVGALAWAPDGQHIIFQRLLKQGTESWRIAATGGKPEKLDATLPPMASFSIHPDGRRIAFAAQTRAAKTEVWVLENFLPPLKDSAPPAAADASAAKGK